MVAGELFLCTAVLAAAASASAGPGSMACNVRARLDAGWVCGLARWAERGAMYASFRGVPYAKQPLGQLRFKELEPPEPWDNLLDATEEGPICYQTDVIYGRLMQPRGMSEACIHANVHVPLEALPGSGLRLTRELQPPYHTGLTGGEAGHGPGSVGLPVLVFIHGGGFMSGSGDADLHGPEYLVSKKVIVITFNYRLNVFGFLSLNSGSVPGNQGLRDMVTLLRWVRRNARAFGGDPDNVTLMGQSAGAVAAHLLTLSDAAKGLFKRAFLMSGTAISGFYTPSPLFAQTVSSTFMSLLGINSTDAEYITRQLRELPVEKIHDAHRILLDQFGLTTFVPTVEGEFPGVTRVLDDYPEALIAKGRGKDVPLVVGFTDAECETFRPRLEQIDIASRITENPVLTVPVDVIYSTPPDRLLTLAKKVDQKYYNGTIDTQGFIAYCTDGLYKYPALKLSTLRSGLEAATVFLYQFSYSGERSAVREALRLRHRGAAHIEDFTYVFRTNALYDNDSSLPQVDRDYNMKEWMTNFVVNFMHCSKPVCNKKWAWPAVTPQRPQFQDIEEPVYRRRDLTTEHTHILEFFDHLK